MISASQLAFMSFGFTEILLVGVVALLVFGGNLPEVMRNVGQAYAKFRQGLHDISKPVREEFRELSKSAPDPEPTPRSTAKPAAKESETPEPEADGGPTYRVEDPPRPAKKTSRPDPWLDDEPPPV